VPHRALREEGFSQTLISSNRSAPSLLSGSWLAVVVGEGAENHNGNEGSSKRHGRGGGRTRNPHAPQPAYYGHGTKQDGLVGRATLRHNALECVATADGCLLFIE
jgi:hypothetical protein